jgi:glycosyltransferase involved in cell wall biosynthesis
MEAAADYTVRDLKTAKKPVPVGSVTYFDRYYCTLNYSVDQRTRSAVGVRQARLALLIPCFNEERTIGKVIDDFRRELPDADIIVIDNCCTDATPTVAADHGALVVREPRKGKGFAVETMLDRFDADIYIMVDGDDTYDASAVHRLIEPILNGDADMTVGTRLSSHRPGSFRPLHVLGNDLVRRLVNLVGRAQLTDIMSGYRGISRRAALRLPVVSAGFEIETDLTMQMLYYGMRIVEVPTAYGVRPEGSVSKLRTFRDGFVVLWKIFTLFREFKPLTFFGGVGLIFLALGVLAGLPPINDYLYEPNHFVKHVPLAILATGLTIVGFGNVFLGILLHALNWRIRELHNVLTRGRHTTRPV